MANVTIYASANSGGILSKDTAYATARSGGGTLSATPAGDARLGQRLFFSEYYCWQYLLEFDLSTLAGATISAATLSLYVWGIDGTGYDIQARAYDFGTFETADFRAGASFASDTLLAHWTVASPDGEYKAFTDDDMVAFLTPGSTNLMALGSSLFAAGTPPTANEFITGYFDNTGGNRPKLDITYTEAAPGGSGTKLLSLTGVGG